MKNNTTQIVMAGDMLAGKSQASNLRVAADGGGLMAVGLPTVVADKALKPVCGMGRFLIASKGGRLYAVDRDTSDGQTTLIADVGEEGAVYCGVAGGHRAIVMTSAGALHLVTDGSEVVCRGTLPELPAIDVQLVEYETLTETVQPVVVTEPESIRGGALSARDATSVAAALDDAWQRIRTRAAMLGAAIIPDGTVITAEVRQLDSMDFPVATRGRISVGPGASPASVQGLIEGDTIGPMVLAVPVLKVRITVDSMNAEDRAVWGDGSVKAQVALSAAPEVEARWSMRVERPSSGEARLTVVPHIDVAYPDRNDALQSVAIIAVGPACELLVDVPVRVVAPIPETIVESGFKARCVAVSGDVVLWGCVEGRPGDVAMAPSCSPLALKARTTVSLSPVSFLVAAPRLGSVALSPGCAHFYAFTSEGILNVSVGSRRGAPAASLLDRRPVSRGEGVAVGPERVIALTDSGDTLIELRGGRASTLYRAAAPMLFKGIAPEPCSGELYMLGQDGEVYAFDVEHRWLSCRPLPYPVDSMAAAGASLYVTWADGMACVSAIDTTTSVAVKWQMPVSLGGPAAIRRIELGLDAPRGFTGSVSIGPAGFPDGLRLNDTPMWRAGINGRPRAPIAFRLPLPVRAAAVVEISGMAAPGTRLREIVVTTQKFTRDEP